MYGQCNFIIWLVEPVDENWKLSFTLLFINAAFRGRNVPGVYLRCSALVWEHCIYYLCFQVGEFISIPHIASIAAICVFLPSLLGGISCKCVPLTSTCVDAINVIFSRLITTFYVCSCINNMIIMKSPLLNDLKIYVVLRSQHATNIVTVIAVKPEVYSNITTIIQ